MPALERHSGTRSQALQAARALEGVGHLRQGFLDRDRRLHLGVHRGPQLRAHRRPCSPLFPEEREIGVYWYLFSNHRTGADLKVIQVTPKSAPYCLRCLPGAENLVQH